MKKKKDEEPFLLAAQNKEEKGKSLNQMREDMKK